jgi:hypothetical protein
MIDAIDGFGCCPSNSAASSAALGGQPNPLDLAGQLQLPGEVGLGVLAQPLHGFGRAQRAALQHL